VWIETRLSRKCNLNINKSRLMQACGLKLNYAYALISDITVTPHAGVWIETPLRLQELNLAAVTPHAGVWIETQVVLNKHQR